MCKACKIPRFPFTCDCPCRSGERQIIYGSLQSPTRRRHAWEKVTVVCRLCAHELNPRLLEVPEDQRVRNRKKQLMASVTAGVGSLLVATGLLILRIQPPDFWLWFSILMISGIAIAFAGFDGLLFGYRSMQDWQEGF